MRHHQALSMLQIKPSLSAQLCVAIFVIGTSMVSTGCVSGEGAAPKIAASSPAAHGQAPFRMDKQYATPMFVGQETEYRHAKAIRIADKHSRGLILSDLGPNHAKFVEDGYDTVLFNVGSLDKKQLVALAKKELAAHRKIVLDSDGSEGQKKALSDASLELAGVSTPSEGALIALNADGSRSYIALETEATYNKRASAANKSETLSRGNTARYLLGNIDLPSR